MNPPIPSLAARIVIRSIALAVAYLGVLLLIATIQNLIHHAGAPIAHILQMALATLCLLLAIGGWLFRTVNSVRRLCIFAAIVLYLFIDAQINNAFVSATGWPIYTNSSGSPATGDLIPDLFFLAVAGVTMLLYHLLVRWLTPGLGLIDTRSPAHRRRAFQLSIGVVTFTTIALGSLVANYLPADSALAPGDKAGRWSALAVLGILVVAQAIYETAKFRAVRERSDHDPTGR